MKKIKDYLKLTVKITDTKEFHEFKNIVLDMLRDERVDFAVREEYYNKIKIWLDKVYPVE